jgi:hypothetical protein
MLRKVIRKLIVNIATFSMLVGMFSPLTAGISQAAGTTGTIFVRTNHSLGSYTIYRTADEFAVGFGSGTVGTYHTLPATYYPGIGYKVVFHDTVPGFEPPATYYFNLVTGAFLSHLGEYYNPEAPTESVTLNANIGLGSYVVYRDSDEVPVGFGPTIPGNATVGNIFMLAAGASTPGIGYHIEFGDVDGYVTPADVHFNLIVGQPKSYTGVYTLEGTEVLYENVTVNTNINSGAYTIYRTPDNAVMGFGPSTPGEGTMATIHSLPAGAGEPGIGYKIVFANVLGYVKPADIYLNLVDGSPQSFTGVYSFGGTAYESVTVNTNIANGSYTIYKTSDDSFVGAGPAVPGQGTVGTTFLLPSGSTPGVGYRIEFGDVSGYSTPLTKFFNLVTGTPFTWTGYYNENPVDGYVTVEVVDEDGNPITTGNWSVMQCTSEDPLSCGATLVSGGAGVVNMPVPVYGPTIFRAFANSISGYGNPVIMSLNPQTLNTGGSITFRIMYPDLGIEFEVSAQTDGLPAAVDFMYCTGTAADNDCGSVQTTSLTGPIYIGIADSGDQFLAFEDLAGYEVPVNQVSFPPELAQTTPIVGHDGFYYYPIQSDEIEEGAVIMNYATDVEGAIEVTVDGPSGLVSAPVTVQKILVGEVGSATINNGDTHSFPVETNADYLVQCGEVDGFTAVDEEIPVASTDFDSVTQIAEVTCEYTEEENAAYLNITTNPVPASVTMNVLSSTPAGQVTPQSAVTSVLTGVPLTYELSRTTPDNRFTLIGDGVTPYVTAQLQIVCNPAPGGVVAPAPFVISPANYMTDAETPLTGCVYTLAPDDEKVTINIDTINVTNSAITVDGVPVRAEGDDNVAVVEISTTEQHVISFADRTGFATPHDITIPADTLTSADDGIQYLGYYVELGFETDVQVTTRTVGGTVYLKVLPDSTLWAVGHVANPGDILLVQVDNRISHEFHFQDRNSETPPYVLRAESEATGHCGAAHEAGDPVTEISGTDLIVTHFQQHYVCTSSTVDPLPDGILLTGHYIETAYGTSDGDAAFFRAKTTNTDVSGEIYANVGVADDLLVFNPGPNTWTPIFVSDVASDTTDNAAFESPVTFGSDTYVAFPLDYTLSDFAPGDTLIDLTSTYLLDVANVTVRLVSLDLSNPAQPAAGMTVVMDDGELDERSELTVNNSGNIEALFETVTTTENHIITCPDIAGFQSPNQIMLPAGSVTPGDHLYNCIYAPSDTAAEIQIQTTAEDQVNLSAAIVLTVEGIDYAIGYTYDASPTVAAHMELSVDSSLDNTINYEDIPPYITPADAVVTVDAGSSYLTDPDNIFVGLYTLPEEATINVYTIDDVITDPAVSVAGAQIDVVRLNDLTTAADDAIVYTTTTGKITDLTVVPNEDYRIDFGPHPTDVTYTAPASIFFNLGNGDEAHYLGAYVKNSCEISLLRQRTDTSAYVNAEVMLTVDGGTQFSIGTGDPAAGANHLVTYMIDQTKADGFYDFDFMPLPFPDNGLPITPASLALPTTGMTCPYERTILYGYSSTDTADIEVTLLEADADDGPVPAGVAVTLNGSTVANSDINGIVTFTDVPVGAAINIGFGNHPLGTAVFTTPADLDFAANDLLPDQTYHFTVYYVPAGNSVTVTIDTVAQDDPALNVNGAIYLVVNGGTPTLLGYGTATTVLSDNSTLFSYDVDWGPTNPASSYMEPLDDPHAVTPADLTAGHITGVYRLCPTQCAVVQLTAYDTSIAPANILSTAGITVNGIPVGSGQHIGTYEVGTVLNVAFEDLTAFQTPRVYIAGVDHGLTHTVAHTVNLLSVNNIVDAVYLPEPETVAFNVSATNDLGAALTAPFTRGGISGTAPASFTELLGSLSSYTINFGNVAGYVTPSSVVVTAGAIAVIPASVTLTLNGAPYVAGTVLEEGDTLNVVGHYEARMLLNKEITAETVITDNNKRVDYRITVTRNTRDAASGDLTMALSDSISATGGTLTGSNGGTMSAVLQGTSYGTCSNGCGDVVLGPVNVTITNPGNSVILTYQTLSNNSAIPASQTSTFTNVATGAYTEGTATITRTDNAQTIVSAATTSGPIGGGGGGGGGTGGGHVMIKGDMVLKIQKLISLDNVNFIDATDPAKAMSMPESKASKVYVKVKVTNEGKVSATDIRFKQAFDALKSAMTAQKMENLIGANLNSKGEIKIDKINVGSSTTFSYSLLVNQPGKNVEVAKDALTMVDFGSALAEGQDFLTYVGIGDEFPSYLGGGVVPSSESEDARLKVTVTSDKSEANIGDIVNFLVTVENLTDGDVTGLDIAHNYDETALEILNTFGGRDDGKEVRYTRAILRPGEKATFQIQAKVSGTAPVGETVKGVTRTLVNEFDGVAPVENLLYIIGGVAPTTPDVKLAQTGPTLAFMLLAFAILAYFGYGKARQLRYLAIKRAALRPL